MYTFSLIKKGDIHLGKSKVIKAKDFSEFLSSHELLEQTKEDVTQKLEETEKECVELRKEAEEKGFEEGLAKFNEHVLQLGDQVKTLRLEMQKALLPLVLRSTKRIIGEQLEINPETVVNIVIESIRSVSQCKFVKIFANRADIEILEKEKSEIKAHFEKIEGFTIEERGDIKRGGCIIETERGILNATLENQYRALERALEAHTKKQ